MIEHASELESNTLANPIIQCIKYEYIHLNKSDSIKFLNVIRQAYIDIAKVMCKSFLDQIPYGYLDDDQSATILLENASIVYECFFQNLFNINDINFFDASSNTTNNFIKFHILHHILCSILD